ncbi:phosphatase PAP2 family protein [Methylobacterium sp. PvR107]|uniref:phosphatase PAP2 family protein n=1 Tax=Methylobacterium sp. PvR107 TaxID=2806597 RepID=UPI001AE7FC84|nr:phosphatase PAP2 family protein [Methylobacterium sp. PvR107]MBP1181456.1 undecaprenyl-diphosphatase [Methylobacterium sp. PvR107]
MAEEVSEGDTQSFDRQVMLLFRHAGDPGQLLGPPWLPSTLRDLTSLGSTVILGLTLVLALGYLAIARKRMAMLFVFASVVLGQALATGLKLLFERQRPDLIPNAPEVFTASFPSGHAMLSAVTYLTLAALLTRIETRRLIQHYFMAAGILLTVLVGVSRVALGVHWPTDVAAGWCAGAAWATVCAVVAARLAKFKEIERLP